MDKLTKDGARALVALHREILRLARETGGMDTRAVAYEVGGLVTHSEASAWRIGHHTACVKIGELILNAINPYRKDGAS